MKLLLDECVTRYLKLDLVEHEVFTVDDAGLKGLKNGSLLRAASGRFDVLITVDRKLPQDQDISEMKIGVLVLIARSNRYPYFGAPSSVRIISNRSSRTENPFRK